MNRVTALVIVVLLFASIVSCSSTEPARPNDFDTSGDQTPEKALRNFRKSLRENEWKYVHVLLSKRARNCYSQDRLKTFLTRTKPGALEKIRLLRWKVSDIRPGSDEKQAILTLKHPRFPDYSETYRLLREDDYWRLDWSMADILNVPRSVENCD